MIRYQTGMAEYIGKTFEKLLNQVQAVTLSETITRNLMQDPSRVTGELNFRTLVHALHVYYKASAILDCDVVFVNGAFWVIIKPFDRDQFEAAIGAPGLN